MLPARVQTLSTTSCFAVFLLSIGLLESSVKPSSVLSVYIVCMQAYTMFSTLKAAQYTLYKALHSVVQEYMCMAISERDLMLLSFKLKIIILYLIKHLRLIAVKKHALKL